MSNGDVKAGALVKESGFSLFLREVLAVFFPSCFLLFSFILEVVLFYPSAGNGLFPVNCVAISGQEEFFFVPVAGLGLNMLLRPGEPP